MTKLSIGPLLIAAFVVLSLAAVAGGFLVIGSPVQQRQLTLDSKRTNDLLQIANAVDTHWEATGSLPASLNDVSNAWVREVADPETGEPYRYRVTGKRTFQLCATFALKDDEPARDPWEDRFARHDAGPHCFDLRAADIRPHFRPPSSLQ